MNARAKSSTRNATADLLFEIGCEEIPAGMIFKASQELKATLARQLSANGLVDEPTVEESIQTFGAPRRLVAIAKNVRVKQEDVTREVMGPPKSVAFGGTGEPTRAAQSFAEKQGIPLSKLTVVNTPKGEYVAARLNNDGVLILSKFAGAAEELADALLINPYVINEFAGKIKEAIEMPEKEQRRHMLNMRKIVAENNIYRWGAMILDRLVAIAEER